MRKEFNAMLPSDDFLRTMIDQMPTLAWSCRPDGSAEFVNQRWLDYTGLSMEEAVGWGWQATIHPEDLGKTTETWLRIVASEEPGEEEARVRRFDGEYRWFLFRAVPVRDEWGKVIRWYGTSTDIEDRKRAEEKLQRSEAYLHEAQRLGHVGSWASNAPRDISFESLATILMKRIRRWRCFESAFIPRIFPPSRKWPTRPGAKRPIMSSTIELFFRMDR